MVFEGNSNHSREPSRGEYFSPLSPEGTGDRKYSPYSEYSSASVPDGDRKMLESHELLVSPEEEGLHPMELQATYSLLPPEEMESLGKEFRRRGQLWRLSVRTFFRFSITLVSCAGTALLYKLYQDKGPLTPADTRMYNALNIAFSLVLGMNVIVSHLFCSHFPSPWGANASNLI